MKEINRHRFDVVIVGGGLAALRAAIAARETGASTAIAVKGMIGRSGSSAITTGGFAAVVPGMVEGDGPSVHAKDTMTAGAGLSDPELVDVVCEHAAEEVRWIEKFGGQFFREPDGSYFLETSGEHTHPRVLIPHSHIGTEYTLPMTEYAREIGVEMFEFTMCVEVLAEEGRVSGALCLDTKQGELVLFETEAVILCTGGCGNMFSFTSNPRDVTGDGYALAYEAGADMRDMEFIQFYPWRCIHPFDKARVSVQPPTFMIGGKLLNSKGERFMQHYDPVRFDATTRDVAARGIYDQIRNGLDMDGGVLLDLSDVTEEMFTRYNPKFMKALEAKKLPYRGTPLLIAPEAHYFMGGVKIDTYGRSSVEGLYTTGETAGGIHGANRANSNALPEILVISARAGQHAGERALQQAGGTVWHRPVVPERWERLIAGCDGSDEADYKAMTVQVRQLMDASLGIIRNEDTMKKGRDSAESMMRQLDEQLPRKPESLRTWFELKTMLRVGQLSMTAGLHRNESRGAHFREDKPSLETDWEGISLILRKNGSMTKVTPSRSGSGDFMPPWMLQEDQADRSMKGGSL